jgi:hypothetical protein
MTWNSVYAAGLSTADDGAFVHLFNENTSWHGHTMLAIEYAGGSFWGLSFQPENEGESSKDLLVMGVRAKIVNRTTLGQQDPGTIGPTSAKPLSYAITSAQLDALQNVIRGEQAEVTKNPSKVTYAAIGRPLYGVFQSGYRDTCYSWAVRMLREAGIISSGWTLTRWLSVAPGTAELFA